MGRCRAKKNIRRKKSLTVEADRLSTRPPKEKDKPKEFPAWELKRALEGVGL